MLVKSETESQTIAESLVDTLQYCYHLLAVSLKQVKEAVISCVKG